MTGNLIVKGSWWNNKFRRMGWDGLSCFGCRVMGSGEMSAADAAECFWWNWCAVGGRTLGLSPFPGVASINSRARSDSTEMIIKARIFPALIWSPINFPGHERRILTIRSFTYPSSRLRWQSWIPLLAAAAVAAEPRNQSCHLLLVVVHSCLHLLRLRPRSIFQ